MVEFKADLDARVLSINAGSSSVRLALHRAGAQAIVEQAACRLASTEIADPASSLGAFVGDHPGAAIAVAAHRVVHGGPNLRAACLIDAAVEDEIARAATLAPLHNPLALAWVRAARAAFGDTLPQVAVFDTAYYAELPPVARHYAIPRELAQRHGLRRHGFHGLAHQAMWRAWQAGRPDDAGGRVVSFQLGAGCSATAVRDGRVLDTSMGFSPLEGLVMATRCGDLDAGLLTHLLRAERLSPEDAEALLNRRSGLLGLSGISGDLRTLLASQHESARLAIDLYCYRARKYLGAYAAVLGGVDAVLFGGGAGEHLPAIRTRILADFEWLGIGLDDDANLAALGGRARISRADSRVAVWVVPVDEAALLAEQALACLASTAPHTQGR
ncbi:MAG: hypothetical protein IT509_12095 [Rhodocyclaceae bacterium]|nr:hypothetical protein [Rhodocyclaceae bacterium]